MKRQSWGQEAARVVAETLAKLPANATLAEKKAALKAAYPFGLRQYWPYKAWCREQAKALGTLKTKAMKKQALRDLESEPLFQ